MLLALLAPLLAMAFAPPTVADGELVREALAGNERMRRKLVERLAPIIRARVRRALASWPSRAVGTHDADDLTNQTWCRLLENGGSRLAAYDPATGVSLEGYVSMITAQLVVNVLEQHRASKRRAAGGTVDIDDAYDLASPNEGPAVQEARQDLRAVWSHLQENLPERGRAVLQLLYADGCDADGAARTLGVEKQVVYNWQFKIRQLARGFLGSSPTEKR